MKYGKILLLLLTISFILFGCEKPKEPVVPEKTGKKLDKAELPKVEVTYTFVSRKNNCFICKVNNGTKKDLSEIKILFKGKESGLVGNKDDNDRIFTLDNLGRGYPKMQTVEEQRVENDFWPDLYSPIKNQRIKVVEATIKE